MREKLLTKEQILISLDRLTRFKNTKDKYFRVFNDIVRIGKTEHSHKRHEVDIFLSKDLTECAQELLNKSISEYTDTKYVNLSINRIIKEYENSVFLCDEETNIYLNNKINYLSACELIGKDSPINLKWLKSLVLCNNYNDLITIRGKNGLKFPIQKVVIVEGLTEETLLPAFSQLLNYDFNINGIHVIPAGGKSQVVKLYYKLSEELKLPIFVLLDKDAEDNIRQIIPKLKSKDKIHLISCGEFEDLLPKSLIIKSVNNALENFASISEDDLYDDVPETKNLENIYKLKGFHDFKKAEFAKLVKNNLDSNTEISQEIKDIINEIKI